MQCPTCGQHTPDDWRAWQIVQHGGLNTILYVPRSEDGVQRQLSLDWMECANPECKQIVIRAHENKRVPAPNAPELHTETWLVYPRKSRRPVDPLIPEQYRKDYDEAALILDASPRMSAVLSRKILGDLLATYANIKANSLNTQINTFIDDPSHPHELRQNLHYLREMGDFSAHTQTDAETGSVIDVGRDEAEWTLDVIDGLFDYFIVGPARSKAMREGMAEKIRAAGRKEIPPLPDDPS